jgi:hypothetical protein
MIAVAAAATSQLQLMKANFQRQGYFGMFVQPSPKVGVGKVRRWRNPISREMIWKGIPVKLRGSSSFDATMQV